MSGRIKVHANWLDRAVAVFSPARARRRVMARTHLELMLRNYEAAQLGRRTASWTRSSADANAANGPALALLRQHARDLVRNNSWAKNGLRVIVRNTVGWGLVPKPDVEDPKVRAATSALWRAWAATPECDADGRSTFYGLERLALRMVAESGEALVRRRWRRAGDGLVVPVQLQLLEPDFIDTSKDGVEGDTRGSLIIQGVEFSPWGQRVAYWLFDSHPGSRYAAGAVSRRVPASEIIHLFDSERAGQVRGVSWLAPAIVNLKDFDEYEDATIMRQKIAALFAAFVTSPNGEPDLLGNKTDDETIEELEVGTVKYLQPGEEVEFTSPPQVQGDGFSERTLRRIASGIGVTYEDLTGDYSQVNFSSARMGRIAHWGNVYDWQWNMLVPQFCDPAWGWFVEAAQSIGAIAANDSVGATWTAPPMPMIDPDKEGLAYTRRVRAGQMTPSEMVREQGRDPEAHWDEYQRDMAELDKRGIWLDSDVRRVSAAGLTQERVGGAGAKDSNASDESASS